MQKIIFFSLLAVFSACTRVKNTAKNVVNGTGELVGQTAAEFADGVNEGVTQTFDCSLDAAKPLGEKGIKAGKFSITSDSISHKNNKLLVYMAFESDFEGTILSKISDKDGKEYGRAKSQTIKAKKDDAFNVVFVFNTQDGIESKSKIILE
ncbi:MAG: hypothetical protein RI894_1372 [Bacteroidota bacterium]